MWLRLRLRRRRTFRGTFSLLREPRRSLILARGASGNDVFWDFPSLVVGVSDSYSQSILVLKTACNLEQAIVVLFRLIHHIDMTNY